MKTKILEKLASLEREHDIEILFAVESGSRAWGFASPDSDYDIRFVYKHKKDWYLNLWEQKDTIQFMTDNDLLDGSGWDVRKALRLLAKSNASFTGWLFSPIVYRADEDVLEAIKKLAIDNFNPVAGFFHFHSMNKNFEELLGTDEMTLKSYFYAIRTALCANWIYKYGTIPPVLFLDMYPLLDERFHAKLDALIQLKSRLIEKSDAPVEKSLLDLVRTLVVENKDAKVRLINKKPKPSAFNDLFLKIVG